MVPGFMHPWLSICVHMEKIGGFRTKRSRGQGCNDKLNPVHIHPSDIRSIFILASKFHLGIPSGLFPLRFYN
jgi:hypothetical protein